MGRRICIILKNTYLYRQCHFFVLYACFQTINSSSKWLINKFVKSHPYLVWRVNTYLLYSQNIFEVHKYFDTAQLAFKKTVVSNSVDVIMGIRNRMRINHNCICWNHALSKGDNEGRGS